MNTLIIYSVLMHACMIEMCTYMFPLIIMQGREGGWGGEREGGESESVRERGER